ncbi:MAG: tRNA ((37)-N1)-methyltransferase TrmD [Bacteroidota bacterium]
MAITPMHIDIITVVPALLESPLQNSICKRAQDKGLVTVNLHNLRDYTTDNYKTVDDYAYGGGAGMVLMIEPIFKCIEALKQQRVYDDIIYMSPDGQMLTQNVCNELAVKKNLILLCGHYKGVDERVRIHLITREISIGDYVLTGGELAAAIVADSVIRLLPGVLSDETSALSDSFQDGLVAPPVFTRPALFNNWEVPPPLLSGNPKTIDQWRLDQSIERTKRRRPDLLK